MKKLLAEIKACRICEAFLPYRPKPILSVSNHSKIIIIGQAPGQKAHDSGIPWNDQSGDNLRTWMGVSREQFYDTSLFGIMPMGFCYPGKGKSGDLPPRPECAPAWHAPLLHSMKQAELTILIGQYAQQFYLQDRSYASVTENVKNYADFLPGFLPLVHPSPRNKIWMKKNPWFETEVLPILKQQVAALLKK